MSATDQARVDKALDAIADLLCLTDSEAEDRLGFRGNRVEMPVEYAERLLSALTEAVALIATLGPAADPAAWHTFMAKYDPAYEQSERGKAHRALHPGDAP